MARFWASLCVVGLLAGAMSAEAPAKAPAVTAAPDRVDFGPVPINRQNFAEVVFTNLTNDVLHIRTAEIAAPFGVFSASDCADLNPGGSCFVDYTAGPTAPGTYRAKVEQPFAWLDEAGVEHVTFVRLRFVATGFVPQ